MCQPSNSMLTYCYYCLDIIINENEPPTITKDDEMCNNIIYVSKHRRDMHFHIFNIRVMMLKKRTCRNACQTIFVLYQQPIFINSFISAHQYAHI